MAFSMGGSGDEDGYAPMAEINIIPLVDVMLVLLIITMITSPFLEQGVNVELPVAKGQNLQKEQAMEDPLILYVTESQNIRLGKESISRAQLADKLNSVFKNRRTKELFVRADKRVPYGVVADIMARVQAAGIERVGLVTAEQ